MCALLLSERTAGGVIIYWQLSETNIVDKMEKLMSILEYSSLHN